MIKPLIFFCILLTGCGTVGELALNTAAGALGNMLDRRVEDKLGNDAGLSDEKLDGKITKKKKVLIKGIPYLLLCKKQNEDEYYECKDRKTVER